MAHLTPPRQSIDKNIEEALISLSKITKIGIVTGSDYALCDATM